MPTDFQPPSLARAEWEHINRVLSDCEGNVSEAARRLGIHRRSLQRKLQRYPPRRMRDLPACGKMSQRPSAAGYSLASPRRGLQPCSSRRMSLGRNEWLFSLATLVSAASVGCGDVATSSADHVRFRPTRMSS